MEGRRGTWTDVEGRGQRWTDVDARCNTAAAWRQTAVPVNLVLLLLLCLLSRGIRMVEDYERLFP